MLALKALQKFRKISAVLAVNTTPATGETVALCKGTLTLRFAGWSEFPHAM
jgi:hypothetical protein